MFKKEIFELPVFSDEISEGFAKDLKVEIRISTSYLKNDTIHHILGTLPDEFIEALRNTKVYISKSEYEDDPNDYNMQFVYPEMDMECKKLMIKLFFHVMNFRWMKNYELNGYPSVAVLLHADKLYSKFVCSMLCPTNGFLTGKVEFRICDARRFYLYC